ncbi:MAG: serine hydrolase domain-containing protein [Hyphomicrobiaceae bacterium]
MKRKPLVWIAALSALIAGTLAYLVATGERGFAPQSPALRTLQVSRLDDAETKALGWNPRRLDSVFRHAATLSSDTMLIVTRARTVAAFGALDKSYRTHSIRKSLLSALVGQHSGAADGKIALDATLDQLGIDDEPQPLSSLQKSATVFDLLRSRSGINHPAAAEGGLTAEKNRRLGDGENQPGTIWAYNNWDYNALTTIFEAQTGKTVAEAFRTGIAGPTGMQDFKPSAVSYISDLGRSKHKAAAFRMSARDLAKFGQLLLNKGRANGKQILPGSWIGRITSDYSETGRDDLRWAHGYLWWLPAPSTGLPSGSFWAWGLGNQALFIVPAWRTVVVHLADTTEFIKRFIPKISNARTDANTVVENMILSCRKPDNRTTDYCIEHRFTTRREFGKLMSRIVGARLQP